MDFSIIGAGKTGSLFATFLSNSGYKINYIVDKKPEKAKELASYLNSGKSSGIDIFPLLKGTILIAVNDDDIRKIFERLWNVNKDMENLIHFSGVLTTEVFKEAAKNQKGVISLHPNLSIKKRFMDPGILNETIFGIEGNEKGLSFIKDFLNKNGLKYFTIDKQKKVYYHSAAVFASNFTQILALISQKLYEKAGIDRKTASKIVGKFLANLKIKNETEPLETTFTGPAIREDYQTMQMECKALRAIDTDFSALYNQLSELIIKYSFGGDENEYK
ncbi:MAG: DUF2520 domain-containing protein [Petrotogales bacterium]